MRLILLPAVVFLLGFSHVTFGDQLIVLDVPYGVKLSTAKDVSLSDIHALPHQLFGLDETQSRILSDVSFFRRPSLLAVITLACGAGGAEAAACADAVSKTAPRFQLSGEAADPLLFQPVAAPLLDKSLLAGTAGLPDSTHPALFAGLDLAGADSLPVGLSDEAGLPDALVRRTRLARAVVDRAIASSLLADSQPDTLQIDASVAGDNLQGQPEAVRRRVAEFAAGLADRLAAAAGRDRAFVAIVIVDVDKSTSAGGAPSLVRVARALMAATETPPVSTPAPSGGMNLALNYDQDFPVMFNLILWLCVVLALAVYAVAYGLWNIDPGKDSIIYRRGYAHAKKD